MWVDYEPVDDKPTLVGQRKLWMSFVAPSLLNLFLIMSCNLHSTLPKVILIYFVVLGN